MYAYHNIVLVACGYQFMPTLWCYVRYIVIYNIYIYLTVDTLIYKKYICLEEVRVVCASVVYIASKPVPTDLIGSVRETESERGGVKVRPRGRTLRDSVRGERVL